MQYLEFILYFHWSRAMCYYSTHVQLTSSDGVMCLIKMFSQVFYRLVKHFYCVKPIDFIFCVLYSNRSQKTSLQAKNKKSRNSTSPRHVLFYSSHAMTSYVIYYSTDARKNEMKYICYVYVRLDRKCIIHNAKMHNIYKLGFSESFVKFGKMHV